jgi:plastocyanin
LLAVEDLSCITKEIRRLYPVKMTRFAPGIMIAAALLLSGCKPDKAVERSSAIDGGVTPTRSGPASGSILNGPAVDRSQFGSITGVVLFKGKPPARVPIDMSMDPACAMSGDPNFSEQYVVASGKLANVYVYIKAGAPASSAPAGTPPVILDQHGCRYIPHVIAVQQGGSVQFRNSDPTMHNIHAVPTVAGNAVVDVSQGPMGPAQTRPFNAPELMLPVRCNNHPWMSAFINVAPNPYFEVTSGDGEFTIRNLPPGTYTLAAVHEKLGEQDVQITVPPHGVAKAKFSFGPQ